MGLRDFQIIGGGIAGLDSALGLSTSGAGVQIFERTPMFDHVGAGLQLGPNAARALQKLGAWDAVMPMTYAPPEIHIRSGQTGKLLTRLILGSRFEQRYGFAYRVAHRADLHTALNSVVSQRPNIILTMGQDRDAQDLAKTGPVIAADGVWSKTRERLFSGSTAVTLPDRIFRSLVEMPKATGDVAFECVNLWMFPGGHVVHYPVGKDGQLNLVAVTQGAEPTSHFAQAAPALMQILALPHSWLPWPAAIVPKLPSWYRDNLLLVGDAAHGTVPYLAQGAAMALEDAACLMEFAQQQDFFAQVEALRKLRTERLGEASLKAGQIYHAVKPMAWLRDIGLSIAGTLLSEQRQDWIYRAE